MSKEQADLIKAILNRISDSKLTSDMSWSTANELTCLVRQLEVA